MRQRHIKRPRRRSTSEGATINYYERHLGDYARDTAHLSLLEHGAYTLLLDRYYVTEKPLPSDERELFRLLRATSKAEKDAVRQVLREFFEPTSDGWRHRRCEEEITRCRDKSSKARSSANARWKGSGPHGGGNANASGTHTERISERNANASKTHDERNALQTPDSRLQTPDSRLQTPDPVDTSPRPLCVSAATSRADTRAHARTAGNPAEIRKNQPETAGTDQNAPPKSDESAHHAAFARLQAAYPPCAGRKDWLSAEHHCRRLIAEGVTWETLAAGVERYRTFIAAGGVSSTAYVLTPVRFFADADRPWAQAWEPPAQLAPNETRKRKSYAELLAEERAKDPNYDPDAPVQVTA